MKIFGEWLEKEKEQKWKPLNPDVDLEKVFNSYLNTENQMYGYDVISVQSLGEWAWQDWIHSLEEWLEEAEIPELPFYFKDYEKMPEMCFSELNEVLSTIFDCDCKVEEWLSYKITLACLGEQEIQKRLKEVGKK
jgi:hypothetical protein